jgi:hypothetical protein
VKPAAPIFDGTADTFDCDLCGNAHPRIIPDEDGVRAEFARRVAARNPGRALPARLRMDHARRWPWVLGALVVVVGLGWFVPARNFVDVALGLVGLAAVLWRPVS